MILGDTPDSHNADLGRIVEAVFQGLLAQFPSDWRGGALRVYTWYPSKHGWFGPREELVGPDEQPVPFQPEPTLLLAIDRLRLFHAAERPEWEIVEFKLSRVRGTWEREVEMIAFAGGGGEA